jgi:Calcineurin-like phosphoesterase
MTINADRRSIYLLLPLVLFVAAWTLAASGQSAPPWSWGPILGAVSEHSVALTWKTTRSVGFDFSYSLAQVYDSSGQWEETLTYEGHKGIAEIWLHDLLAGEAYRFQLVFYEGDAVYPTEVGTFQTIEPDARSFSFATYGGTASHPDRHKLVADTIAQQTDVSLVIHSGGLVEYPSEDRFENFFWAISNLGRISPYMAVIGEHDRDDGLYFESFALPSGGGLFDEQWWSFDYGPIHFIGLDSTLSDLTEEAAMQEQTLWLKQDLAQAQTQIIVVFSADPIYSAAYDSGENERLLSLWGPAFQEFGVDVVFSSTVHCYEHIYRSGIHYVVTGGGGAPLISSPPSSISGTVFRRFGLLHYIVGTIADNALQIEAIPVATVLNDVLTLSASGRSIDTFVVQREE